MKIILKPLSAQTVVITGGSSGIGLATARKAAAAGAAVVIAARNEAALQRICADINAGGGRAAYAVADVGDEAAVERIAETAERAFGGFDTWVNNAGVGVYGALVDLPTAEHERVFKTNYWGVVFGSKAAVKRLRGRPGGGVLINVGSVNSDLAIPLLSSYSASKHAVKGFTEALRMELMHAGAPVSVTLIKPSGIATPFPSHARNHMDSEPRVVPPAYAPELVADAILHAAQHRVRDMVVGSAGRLVTVAAAVAPSLMDRLAALAAPRLQRTGRPKSPGDNLFEAGADGRIHREQGGGRAFSLYTAARMRPWRTAGLGLAAGLAAVALTSRSRSASRLEDA